MSCYIICDKEIILKSDDSLPEFSDLQRIKDLNTFSDYFEEKQSDLKVLGLKSKDNLPDSFKVLTLREYSSVKDEEESFRAFRAKGLLTWRMNYKFCPACGAGLIGHPFLTARKCPQCHKVCFPHIEPCIIVVVKKDEKVLLARHAYRNQDIFACIAGFVESGESAEHAVAREVFEETKLKVKNIIYRGSQSWPFPNQFMLGFTAEYDGGELVLQKEEITEAGWFDVDNLPASPKPGSIAYRLIHGLY